MKANVETVLDEYSYTDATTQADIATCIQNVLGNDYTITWLEDYSVSAKVDGAEVWARVDTDSEYTLYGTVPGQDKAAHGIFVINKGTESVVVELNKVFEKAECKKYELTGIQKTNGAGISNTDTTTCHYDETSELLIVNGSTIYGNHLNGTKIDAVLGAGVSDNIKAVIVNGNFDAGAWCAFAYLNGLEVAILSNDSTTSIGNANFAYCPNLKYVYIPNNILTTKPSSNGTAHAAFYGCSALKNVLVGSNFEKSTFYIDKVNNAYVVANAVTRYDINENKVVAFYNDALKVTAVSVSDLESKLKALSSYDESFELVIEKTDTNLIVTINNLLSITVLVEQDVKVNINTVLSNYNATNETTSDDILNEILGVPGVQSVKWSNAYAFKKIFATDGARIKLEGEVVDGGLVKGYYGSVTGLVTVTTVSGETFDAKVALIIDPVYETIDCNKVTYVTIASDDDMYLTSEGYDSEADLIIINITNPSANIPTNYFGGTSEANNTVIKSVIVNDAVSTVLEKAFQHTSALEAVVFANIDKINNYGFYASGIRYIEFGKTGSTFDTEGANAFASCKNLKGIYIADRDSATISTDAFVGCDNLAQIYIDADAITNIAENSIPETTVVVCEGTDAVSKFEAAGALSVIDATARVISDHDVTNDFEVNIIDLVRLKKMIAATSDDTNYDINGDGEINSADLISMRQELLGVLESTEITELNNSYCRLMQDNELNVAYFGGSVTSGYGASSTDKRWATLVTNHLANKYPQAKINSLNAAIGGTGSEFGAYRLVKDLQLETFTPDLVFLDSSVNDVYDDTNAADSKRNMETIIRTIYSYAPNADIVIVFITNSGSKGQDFEQLVEQRELAKEYGIPCVNVGKALCDEMSEYVDMNLIDGNSPEWLEYFTDTVHPNDAGYEKYASYITAYLDTVFYPHRVADEYKTSYMPESPLTEILVLPEIFNAVNVDNISNFTITNDGFLRTETENATLTVTFSGTSFKLWCYVGPQGSELEYSVDNGATKNFTLTRGSANHKIFDLAQGLEDTEHTVKMTFKNITSTVDIRYFLITGETKGKNFSITE